MTTIQQQAWLDELQSLVTNSLDVDALRGRRVAGILGDVPSTYAKSPRLWNAAFEALQLDARYIPLDIQADRLAPVLRLLRTSEDFLGGSVTVPYKSRITPLLDQVDPLAARIGAVNVVVRTGDGRLVGHNTDGLGGLLALTEEVLPGQPAPLSDVTQARVLLMGAGGAAQALAFYLWERMMRGELVVANRTRVSAEALINRLRSMRAGRLAAIEEADIAVYAPRMDVILNATVKGQAGIRKLGDGRWTCMEPYSSLGPAHPAVLEPAESEHAFHEAWFQQSAVDIRQNHEISMEVCARLPRAALCYDIIYAPLETVFMRHARWSGHLTLNGKAMNLVQAVEAFRQYVCRDWLGQLGLDASRVHTQVYQAMAEAWAT